MTGFNGKGKSRCRAKGCNQHARMKYKVDGCGFPVKLCRRHVYPDVVLKSHPSMLGFQIFFGASRRAS